MRIHSPWMWWSFPFLLLLHQNLFPPMMWPVRGESTRTLKLIQSWGLRWFWVRAKRTALNLVSQHTPHHLPVPRRVSPLLLVEALLMKLPQMPMILQFPNPDVVGWTNPKCHHQSQRVGGTTIAKMTQSQQSPSLVKLPMPIIQQLARSCIQKVDTHQLSFRT